MKDFSKNIIKARKLNPVHHNYLKPCCVHIYSKDIDKPCKLCGHEIPFKILNKIAELNNHIRNTVR